MARYEVTVTEMKFRGWGNHRKLWSDERTATKYVNVASKAYAEEKVVREMIKAGEMNEEEFTYVLEIKTANKKKEK